MVEVVARMSTAWLRSQLKGDAWEWESACVALKGVEELGFVESK